MTAKRHINPKIPSAEHVQKRPKFDVAESQQGPSGNSYDSCMDFIGNLRLSYKPVLVLGTVIFGANQKKNQFHGALEIKDVYFRRKTCLFDKVNVHSNLTSAYSNRRHGCGWEWTVPSYSHVYSVAQKSLTKRRDKRKQLWGLLFTCPGLTIPLKKIHNT